MLKELACRMWRKLHKLKANYGIQFHSEFFYSHNLNDFRNIPHPTIPIKTITLLPENEERLRDVWPINLNHIRKRWEAGHSECFITFANEVPAAYHWVQFRGIHFIQQAEYYYNLEQKNAFIIYHVRVSNAFKSKGISSFVYNTILQEYKKKGFSKGLIYTASTNIPNQKSLSKLGFKKDFDILSIRIGKKFHPLTGLNKLKKWPT